MIRLRIGVVGAAIVALIAACAHDSGIHSQTAAGQLAFDTMRTPPGPTVVVRVQNGSDKPVRVFAEANEDTNEVANVPARTTQTVYLGPQFFRFALTTFEVRPANDTASALLGPLSLNMGDRVRIVVAANLDSSHVFQNGNW